MEALRRRGFSFNQVLSGTLSNGDQIELGLIDWQEFKEINADNPMLAWFHDGFPLLE